WQMQFIDAGHLSFNSNGQNLLTTNNFTERMNRQLNHNYQKSKQLLYLLNNYGIKLLRKNLHPEGSNKNIYEARLVTPFNAQSIEQ
ncbi:3531_t:CDS:1, partial [Racocetra fulgida]